jgi:hypothetical protein
MGYHMLASGNCEGESIQTRADCNAAARFLGLADTSSIADGQTGVTFDPPWCYYESNSLKFNPGLNTGPCTAFDRCLCHGIPPPSTPPPPPPPRGTAIEVTAGAQWCTLTSHTAEYPDADQCVTDGIGVDHGNNERCTMLVNQAAILFAPVFETENRFDYITIYDENGYSRGQYSGGSSAWPAEGVPMGAGSTFTWRTDGSVTNGGFIICSRFMTPPNTPPAPPPPPVSPSPASPPASPSPLSPPNNPGVVLDQDGNAALSEEAQDAVAALPAIIGVSVAVAVVALGAIAFAIIMLRRRKRRGSNTTTIVKSVSVTTIANPISQSPTGHAVSPNEIEVGGMKNYPTTSGYPAVSLTLTEDDESKI